MTTIDSPENFAIGRVVSRTFAALFANIALFLALSALITAPMLVIGFLNARNPVIAGLANGTGLAAGQLPQFFTQIGLSTLVSTVCTYLLQAALVQGTIAWLNGERPTFASTLSTGFRSLVPVVVIAVLSLLGMMLGFLLLAVPGIILAMMWMVVVPVRVIEHTGIMESFGRSRALTKGYRWKLFLLMLLYAIVIFAISFAIRPLLGMGLFRAGPTLSSIPAIVTNWVQGVVFATLSALGVTSIYYELRQVKEGAGPQSVAAAFD